MSILVVSCGSGGSGSSGSTSAISPVQPNESLSYDDASLTVNFPLDQSLAVQELVSFSGRVQGLPNYSNTEIRVTSASGTYSSELSSDIWVVEDVPLAAVSAGNYSVELLADGEVLDSSLLQLGFEQSFYPFGIGESLVLNQSDSEAYLFDAGQIFQIDLLSGERSIAFDLSSDVAECTSGILWMSGSDTLLFVCDDKSLYAAQKSGSGWQWNDQLEGVQASAAAVSREGDNLYAYDSSTNALSHYSSDFNLVQEIPLVEHLSLVERMASLDSETLLLFGNDSLVLFDLTSATSETLTVSDLGLGSIGALAVDASRNQVYVRSASNNELWRLSLALGVDPGFSAENLDLAGLTSYAMAFSDAQDALLFSSSNQLNELAASTGALQVISSLGWGDGEDWVAPASLALDVDGDHAYVSDLATDDIYLVDLIDGTRSPLNANGESMEAVTGMVQDGQNLYSVDWVKKSVLMTNVDSGLTADLILDASSQPDLSEPIAIDLDASSFRAFVLDRGLRAICEVDTASGNASVLISSLDASALALAKDLSFDESSQMIYWLSWLDNSVHKLNLNNLQSELISGRERGSGENFSRPGSIALNTVDSMAYVSDAMDSRIFSVNLDTGERRVVSNSSILLKPESIAYDSARGLLSVLDAGSGALYALDPSTGDLVLISM